MRLGPTGAVALTAVSALIATAARAETTSVERRLRAAEDAFLDVEYDRALDELEAAEREGGVSDEHLGRILALRGTILFLQERTADAGLVFARLLTLEPGFQLPDEYPPRVSEFLESVRRDLAQPPRVDHVPPPRLEPGEPTRIEAEITNLGTEHSVGLFYRREGDTQYASTDMVPEAGGLFVGVLPPLEPDPDGEGLVAEYFILVSLGTERVANAGSPRHPYRIVSGRGAPARRPERPERTPAWRSWWLWTAIGGGVALALGLGLGLGLTQGGAGETGAVSVDLCFTDCQ